eukprot:TRINITY_DN4277_c0_g1_i1.p1 TRINITY_DN4277_c0_g1~~TRINITY_DN4277_c0_g1_i1.p1  ORF type:complete len:431 (-),score=97.56 TRINITY_DN4277_c0_g1_i1:36-1328(-)
MPPKRHASVAEVVERPRKKQKVAARHTAAVVVDSKVTTCLMFAAAYLPEPRDLSALASTSKALRTLLHGPSSAPIWQCLLDRALAGLKDWDKVRECVEKALAEDAQAVTKFSLWEGLQQLAVCKEKAIDPVLEDVTNAVCHDDEERQNALTSISKLVGGLLHGALTLVKTEAKSSPRNVTQSKLLGRPALHPRDQWPSCGENLVPFQCQINFAEIFEAVPCARLLCGGLQSCPRSGLLVMFNDPDDNGGSAFYYTQEELGELQPMDPPVGKKLSEEIEEEKYFTFRLAVSVPPFRNVFPSPVEELLKELAQKGHGDAEVSGEAYENGFGVGNEEGEDECAEEGDGDKLKKVTKGYSKQAAVLSSSNGMFCHVHLPANGGEIHDSFLQLEHNPLGCQQLQWVDDGRGWWYVTFDLSGPRPVVTKAENTYDC